MKTKMIFEKLKQQMEDLIQENRKISMKIQDHFCFSLSEASKTPESELLKSFYSKEVCSIQLIYRSTAHLSLTKSM